MCFAPLPRGQSLVVGNKSSQVQLLVCEHALEILFQFCLLVCNLDCELIVNDQLINRYCGLIDFVDQLIDCIIDQSIA